MFHDAGLSIPFSETQQRFELDGADHARKFLLDRGFSEGAAEVVWTAIALHTTPAIPGRMGPETAAMNQGVLTDALGWGLDRLDGHRVDEIVAAHPRGDFKKEFLQQFVDGLKDRPDTTYGTINADVLEHFVPGFRRASMVERVLDAPCRGDRRQPAPGRCVPGRDGLTTRSSSGATAPLPAMRVGPVRRSQQRLDQSGQFCPADLPHPAAAIRPCRSTTKV